MKKFEKIKTVVFPVAGIGTRFLPATKSVAKELIPILNRPLIEYAVEEAQSCGFEKFVFVLSEEKLQLTQHFLSNKRLENQLRKKNSRLVDSISQYNIRKNKIFSVIQKKPLGLGHAIWCAREHIDGPFAVILPDDLIFSKTPCIKQLVDQYYKYGKSILGVQEVTKNQVNRYGIIKTTTNHLEKKIDIIDLIEKPNFKKAPSNIAIIGRYVLSRNIIDELSNKEKGSGGEIQLTDAIKNSLTFSQVFGYKFQGKRFDCGNMMGALEAQIYAAINRSENKRETIKILKKYIKKDL